MLLVHSCTLCSDIWEFCIYVYTLALFERLLGHWCLYNCRVVSGSFIWVQHRLSTTAGWLEATTLCVCVRLCVVGGVMGYGQVCLQHERINFFVNLRDHVPRQACVLPRHEVCVRAPSGAGAKTNHWMSALSWQMSWNKMGGNWGKKKRRRHEEGGEGQLPLCAA